MFRFIDLFCGIGGFRVALEVRGHQCVFSSEIDHHAKEAYKSNFGEYPAGDITQIDAADIPAHDVLCAGLPCQSFSISGKQGGVKDPRGRLFFEVLRIAEYHQPKVLLLENVKNILSIDSGDVMRMIRYELNRIGYIVHTIPLNASKFGVPQARERIYFVALRKDLVLSFIRPKGTFEPIYLESVLETEVDDGFILRRNDIQLTKADSVLSYELSPIQIGTVGKDRQGYRIYSTKGHAVTQTAKGGGVGARTGLYLTPQGVRRLTIAECKRVMGFPETHIVSDGAQGYQQLGNAVIPHMIGVVFDGIVGL